MVKLSEIDNIFLYSYQSDDMDIKEKINFNKLEIENGIIKMMRNNFSRFWNLISKEQRQQYILLSLQQTKNKEITIVKEEEYETIEKIIRYSCEVSKKEFVSKFIGISDVNDYYYNYEYMNYLNDDYDELFHLRHDIVKFWISMSKEKKKKFIEIVKNYWEKNIYNEYKIWNENEIKEEEKMDIKSKGLKSIDLIINDNIKYLICSQNKIERLDDLPVGLEVLICEDNPIKSLNNLPRGLKKLCCNGCDITEILNLPPNLRYLDISNIFLESIELPQYIETLYINMLYQGYNIKILEDIPNMIKELELVNEKIKIKKRYPYGIEKFKRNDYIDDSSEITDYIGLPRSIKKLERFKCD